MESIYPEFALYGGQNERARTDIVFFPISQVCPRGVSLVNISCLLFLQFRSEGDLKIWRKTHSPTQIA